MANKILALTITTQCLFSVNEVIEEPDIMGDLRDVVETFYKRDHVEIVEETQLKENMFFTDLNFTHEMRVTHIRWHPTLTGIFAMSVMENALYEPYLKRLSNRLSMPNMLMIWSMAHPLFPQVIKQFFGQSLCSNTHFLVI